jgi:hypothetical protein
VKKSSGSAADMRPDGMPVGTPFKPGQSGNPNGLPKGYISLKTHLKNILNTRLTNEPDLLMEGEARDMTAAEKMMMNLVVKAVADSDLNAIRTILEHLKGKPAQSLNLGGQGDDNPVVTRGQLTVTLVPAKGSSDE